MNEIDRVLAFQYAQSPGSLRPSLLVIVFLAAVLFPYIQFVPIGTEGVQPLALCLAIPVILFSRRWLSAPAPIWLLACLMLIALCVLFVGDLNLPAVRSFGNYTSLFFITLASYC